MTPGYRGGNGEEAARHKHSRANCSGDTAILTGKPKACVGLGVYSTPDIHGVSWNSVRGHARGPRDSIGTHGKESLLHPFHSRARKSGMRVGGELVDGLAEEQEPKDYSPCHS